MDFNGPSIAIGCEFWGMVDVLRGIFEKPGWIWSVNSPWNLWKKRTVDYPRWVSINQLKITYPSKVEVSHLSHVSHPSLPREKPVGFPPWAVSVKEHVHDDQRANHNEDQDHGAHEGALIGYLWRHSDSGIADDSGSWTGDFTSTIGISQQKRMDLATNQWFNQQKWCWLGFNKRHMDHKGTVNKRFLHGPMNYRQLLTRAKRKNRFLNSAGSGGISTTPMAIPNPQWFPLLGDLFQNWWYSSGKTCHRRRLCTLLLRNVQRRIKTQFLKHNPWRYLEITHFNEIFP